MSPLSGLSPQITLAGSLAGNLRPEHPRISHLIYRKLLSSESPPTRPLKRWLLQNTPLQFHMRCMRVGKETTMFKIVVIVNVVSVSYSVGYV